MGYENNLSTKEKILKVTLDIIAKEGFHNITIRKIACEAGVNIAAVNYHFGSKDKVINEALKYFSEQMISVFKTLQEYQDSPRKRLHSFLTYYAETIYLYPDIIKYMIFQNIFDLHINVGYQEFLKNEGIQFLTDTIKEIHPEEDDLITCMRGLQLLSSLSFPMLLENQLKETTGFNCFDNDNREKYIELLLSYI